MNANTSAETQKYNYQFTYRTTAADIWKLSMYNLYGSIAGLCNGIFTVAMILLTVKFWGTANELVRILLILACLIFPVFQPIGIFVQARRQAALNAKQMTLAFDEGGMQVTSEAETARIPWQKIGKISKKPGIIVIFASKVRGYILTKRVLGNEETAFYEYLADHMERSHRPGGRK